MQTVILRQTLNQFSRQVVARDHLTSQVVERDVLSYADGDSEANVESIQSLCRRARRPCICRVWLLAVLSDSYCATAFHVALSTEDGANAGDLEDENAETTF